MDIETPERKSSCGSPSTKKRKIELEEKKYDNTWQSCSGCTLDKRATIFFSQLLIALIIILFCIYQLIHSESCERDSLYSSILTLVLGVFLPNPRMERK